MSEISTSESSISEKSGHKNPLSLGLKINLIGDTNVGKTSLINQYISKQFINSLATIGLDCYKKTIEIEHYKFNLTIWDTAGQQIYLNLTKNSLRGVDILMIVFDVTNRKTFKNLEYWYEEIKDILDFNRIIFCLIANKIDLEEKQEVFYEEYFKYSNSINAKLFETNAINFDIVNQMFENSVYYYYEQFLKGTKYLPNLSDSHRLTIVADKNTKKKKTKCCS